MIRLTPKAPDLIKMEIQLNLPQMDVINFLHKKGYKVEAYTLVLPDTEEMLVSEPRTEIRTFTATKEGEKQTEENIYLNVFKKELQNMMKEIC